MMDFFDALQLSVMFALHEYFDEKEKQKKAKADFQQQCLEGVSNGAVKISETISNNVISQYGNKGIPESIGQGMLDLPMYAMLRVAKKQRWVSDKQNQILDMFFRHLQVTYTKQEFLLAINGGGILESRLQKSVGLGEPVGDFWKPFFAVMRKLQNQKDIMGDLIEGYADIVMNFAYLNSNAPNVAETEVKSFISSLSRQYEKSFNSNDEFDVIGEHDWQYHKNRIINLSHDLIIRAGAAGELDMSEMLDMLFKTILFDFVRESNQSLDKQKDDYAFISHYTNSTTPNLSPEAVFDEQLRYPELLQSANNYPVEFVKVIQVMGTNANAEDESGDITRSIINFMFSVENILLQRNQYTNYEGLSKKYCSKVLEKALKELEG